MWKSWQFDGDSGGDDDSGGGGGSDDSGGGDSGGDENCHQYKFPKLSSV